MSKLKKDLIVENELLLARLDKLEKLLEGTSKQVSSDNEIISMTKVVKVVSLYTGILNLKTSNGSDSVVFKFNFFGDEQPIFYNDLVKCIAIQQRFFREGYCMILDTEVINAHYLKKYYENLLTKDQIDNFLNYSEAEINEKYIKLPVQQKITVLERIAIKINEKENVDRNKVDIVSKITKQDIYKLAEKLR